MALLLAAALAAASMNPLLGTWVRERSPERDAMNVAAKPRMIISPGMIQFLQNGMGISSTSIRRVEKDGDRYVLSAADGETFRFHFEGKNRICDVPERVIDAPMVKGAGRQPLRRCWTRAAAPPGHEPGL